MKVKKILLPILMIILALLAISCDDNPKYGVISISLDDSSLSRTIKPTDADLKCVKYTIEGHKTDLSASFEEEEMINGEFSKNLLIGEWSFTAMAYNALGELIAIGQDTFEIKVGSSTNETIYLEYLVGGSGTLDLKFRIKDVNDIIDKIVLRFDSVTFDENNKQIYTEITDTEHVLGTARSKEIVKSTDKDENHYYSFNKIIENIPTEQYRITASLMDKNNKTIDILTTETIHIHNNLTSSYEDTIDNLKAATPKIELVHTDENEKYFRLDSKVKLSSNTEGAIIYFTTEEGKYPFDEGSNTQEYDGEFTLDKDCTVKAIATKAELYNSDVVEKELKILLRTPIASKPAGQDFVYHNEITDLTFTTTEDGVSLPQYYYQKDMTLIPYNEEFAIDMSKQNSEGCVTICVQATKEGCDKVTGSYSYFFKVAPVKFTINGQTYSENKELTFTSSQELTLSSETQGSDIYYTTSATANFDKNNISSDWVKYNAGDKITINTPTKTIRAIAIKSGWEIDCGIIEHNYKLVSSAGLSVGDPKYNNLTLDVPTEWKNNFVVPGVGAIITAKLENPKDNVSYKWYLTRDGKTTELVNMKTNELLLGTHSSYNVYLYPGINTIKCEAVVDGRIYSAEYRVSVSAESGAQGKAEVTSPYKIGSKGPAGGWVFYDVDADNSEENNGAGPDGLKSEDLGWRYLEAAPEDIKKGTESRFIFGIYKGNGYARDPNLYVNGTHVYDASNCTLQTIGSGEENTKKLINKMGDKAIVTEYSGGATADYAANLCKNYSITVDDIVYDDWFLPSINELEAMYENLHVNNLGSFYDDHYWSSSENPNQWCAGSALKIYFWKGDKDSNSCSNKLRVRAIRSFSI